MNTPPFEPRIPEGYSEDRGWSVGDAVIPVIAVLWAIGLFAEAIL